MKSRLLVPVRDRRQRRRILTLKNFGIFAVALIIIFAGVSLYSEFGRKPADDYGRLYARQVQSAEPKQPNLEIVQETPISDETSVDPMLLAPAAREQYLGTYSQTAAMIPPTDYATDFIKPVPMTAKDGERLSIVGDSTGVGIVVEKEKQPTLSGGIFKQE